MKSYSTFFFTVAVLLLCALPSEALIIQGGDEGHTTAPPDDPGWNNIGYVRSMWNTSRAGGVYIGDGWVLTAYHVIYYDAPTGIVFNAEPNKTYPIDITSYVRLNTNAFTRFAEASSWTNYYDVYPELPSNNERKTLWASLRNSFAPEGADLAMFRLTEMPNIDPVYISEIPKNTLPLKFYWGSSEVTAIATGHPRQNDLSYWTTNWTETTQGAPDAAYSGYYDWPNREYSPICRWGKNWVDYYTQIYDMGLYGKTACFRTTFTTNSDNLFQMARLDSGGGVFYKGSGQWELLGLLTGKQRPDGGIDINDNSIHPYGSHSLISDLTWYREQIMNATEWPDLIVSGSSPEQLNMPPGSQVSIDVIIKNQSSFDVKTNSYLSLYVIDESYSADTPETHMLVGSIAAGQSLTNTMTITAPAKTGSYILVAKADDDDEIFSVPQGGLISESKELNNEGSSHYSILRVGPDLSVSFSQTNTLRAMAGTTVKVYADISNNGAGSVTGTENVLQLSTNNTFEVYSNVATNSGTGSLLFSLKAPSEPGTYYLRAQTDTLNQTVEFNEYNNFSDILMLNVTPLSMPWLNLLLD